MAVQEDAVWFAKRDTPDRVTFETLQRLSKYRDIMIRIAHTLDANIAALNKLLALARKRQKKCESKEPAEEDESFSESIQTCIVEQEMLKHHVGLVESSSQELGALVVIPGVEFWDDRLTMAGSKYNHSDRWECNVDADAKDYSRSSNNENYHFHCAYLPPGLFHFGTPPSVSN